MKELINHFVFDTVSLQIVAMVLLGFWIQARRLRWVTANGEWASRPSHAATEGGVLALALFMLISMTAKYYGAPWLMVGKIGLWAVHVGLLAAIRWYLGATRSHEFRSFLEDAARFEAIASLGILFLK